MKNIEKDILKAKELIEDYQKFIPKHHQFEKIYPFTNENIKDCFGNFQLLDKKCLTVLSSADQTLDICLKGSNNITTFDINSLTKYYYYLKKAALESNITLKEYLDFFCYQNYPSKNNLNKNSFNKDTFSKLVPYLHKENNLFWTTLFNEYSPNQIRASNGLFQSDELKHTILTKTINYLTNEYNFCELKEKIKDINFQFINTNIINLSDNLTEKFDFIYLSNIIQYIDKLYKNTSDNKDENNLYKIKQFYLIIKSLINHLNKNGTIICGYLYNSSITNSNISIYNQRERNQIFNEEFQYYYFNGINELTNYNKIKYNNDYCLIYTKK